MTNKQPKHWQVAQQEEYTAVIPVSSPPPSSSSSQKKLFDEAIAPLPTNFILSTDLATAKASVSEDYPNSQLLSLSSEVIDSRLRALDNLEQALST